MHKLRTLHLFAGAGGGLLADLLLGHQCVCAVEINDYCQQVLSARQKDGILPWFPIFGDIQQFDGNPWRGLVDVIACGFPCQNISPSGDRTGLEGEKSSLWRDAARVVREVRPRILIVENSSALTVRGIAGVMSDLAEMGYDAQWGVLGAADAIWIDGTPAYDHERLRCFITATYADRSRKLQSKGSVKNQWRRTGHSNQKTSNADVSRLERLGSNTGKPPQSQDWDCALTPPHSNSIRQQSKETSKKFHVLKNGNNAASQSRRNTKSVSIVPSDNRWWANEPGVGRMVNGMANRNDRVRAIGNGQVPAVVALAWHLLNEEL